MAKQLPRSKVIMHWITATSVFFLFVSSWWMLSLPLPSDVFTYRQLPFQLHKNIGITLLAIVVTMIAMRVYGREQSIQANKTRLEKLADVDHLLTYFLLIACCISGYLSSAYSGWETTLWWLVDLPGWSEENDDLNILFSDIHLWTCWALLAVVALHISAALYHAFKDDGVIDKMFRL
ncbi:MAG: cytochrome b/b6 domain-containing protein [Gammaproteobacteria bacterium]|nr:cytochrome b/b6 domain-containing protein [Gammaproteobacteria bacterium]MDD9895249.1 cytochrome b/b6 domain-containing protein [Gammaproteobacteria bacterium]MDD9958869.1 cytochrome b/b6 domain-containing protein [Gammaproteobacteria bacterium]